MAVLGNVEDRQPPVPERDAQRCIGPNSVGVGPAVDERLGHSVDRGAQFLPALARGIEESGDAAHRVFRIALL